MVSICFSNSCLPLVIFAGLSQHFATLSIQDECNRNFNFNSYILDPKTKIFGLPVGGLVTQAFELTKLGPETFTKRHLLNSYLPSLIHVFFFITNSSLSNGVWKKRFFLESKWNVDLQYEQEMLVDVISVFYSLNRFIKSSALVLFFSDM